MRKGLFAAGMAILLVACSSQEPPEEKTTKSLKDELLTYRSANEVCTSETSECIEWTKLMLKCEENLAKMVPGNACTIAEEYREDVTGIELSSSPGAYNF